MSIVLEPNFTLENLGDFFNKKGIVSNIVEVAPAAPEWDLKRDAYLEIIFNDDKKIIIWKDNRDEFILRIRGIIFNHKETKSIKSEIISETTKRVSQQAECFGSIDAEGLGVNLEYKLPLEYGILDETIYSAHEELKKGMERYISLIELAMKWDEED